MAIPANVFVADFETTTDAEDCRVWAYGIAAIDKPDDVSMGTSLLEFLRLLIKTNTTVYFHNLKFDGTFIINELLRQGYEWSPNRTLAPREFSTLYSDTGKLYSINVRWTRMSVTEFRDSLKKLPMSVAVIAKAFGLEEGKGELDYHAHRPVGHEITEEEADYIRRDVAIVAHAVGQTLSEGMTRLTVGADSLADYKKIVKTRAFKRLFPVVDADTDLEIRQAYRGGYTYADKRHSGKHHKRPGMVFDVNSLYPSVMYDRKLPFGLPLRGDGKPTTSDIWIAHVTFTAKLRKNFIPIIQVKKSFQFGESEYLERIDEPVTLSVTNIDWQLWNKHYDIEVIEWHYHYEFQSAAGMFVNYIDKWMKVKAESTGGKREIAKLHLNSLYGKFATSTNVTGKYPVLEDGAVKWITDNPETRNPIYTAMGAFITAYAREVMITAAQDNYDIFAYCDTDSLHVFTDETPDGLNVHPTELGAWKFEGRFTEAKYLRAKAYAELIDGKMDVKLAGVPRHISGKLTFDQLRAGYVIHGKLVPRNVPGGVVLVDAPYEIKL